MNPTPPPSALPREGRNLCGDCPCQRRQIWFSHSLDGNRPDQSLLKVESRGERAEKEKITAGARLQGTSKMNPHGYVFVLTPIELLCPAGVEVAPAHRIVRANNEQVEYIKQVLLQFNTNPFFQVSPYENRFRSVSVLPRFSCSCCSDCPCLTFFFRMSPMHRSEDLPLPGCFWASSFTR